MGKGCRTFQPLPDLRSVAFLLARYHREFSRSLGVNVGDWVFREVSIDSAVSPARRPQVFVHCCDRWATLGADPVAVVARPDCPEIQGAILDSGLRIPRVFLSTSF